MDLDRYDCGVQHSVCCHLGRQFRIRVHTYATVQFEQTLPARGYNPGEYYSCPPPAFGYRENNLAQMDFEATMRCVDGVWTSDDAAGTRTRRQVRYVFDDGLPNRGLWHSNVGYLETLEETQPVSLADIRQFIYGHFLDPHYGLSQFRAMLSNLAVWPFPNANEDRASRMVCNGDAVKPYVNPEAPFSSAPGRCCVDADGNDTVRGSYHWQGNADCRFSNFTETLEQDVATCYVPAGGSEPLNWRYGRILYHGNAEVLIDRVIECESPCSGSAVGRCDLPDGSCNNSTQNDCIAASGIWAGPGTLCGQGPSPLDVLRRLA